jgi:aspartate dehydrogenase
LNVGLIGCGAIGRTLARAIVDGKAGEIDLVAICDIDRDRVEGLYKLLNRTSIFTSTTPEQIITLGEVEFIIEAASQTAVEEVAETVLNAGKNLMIMSVGALKDGALLQKLRRLATERKVSIYLPSGAICGLDGVKGASVEEITSAEIISTKNPKSLEGAPYLVENDIRLEGLTEPKVLFEGSANDAARGFPKNVNVAVALSLAGIGVEKTRVKVVADPTATRTQHEIRIQGDFGDLHVVVRNLLHPENPKTSYLAALSAIRTLRKLTEPIQIGT